MAEHLIIFDTTLRDGEQSPGASMTNEEKMRIAKRERLRVDVIEAGFPPRRTATGRPFMRSRARSRTARSAALPVPTIATSSAAAKRSVGEIRARAHVHRTSPIHMQMKLRMTPDQVFERGGERQSARPEAHRRRRVLAGGRGTLEPDFLCRLLEAVIAAGATTVTIPDTVGYTTVAILAR
jgi:2-isopropylmalate synthase